MLRKPTQRRSKENMESSTDYEQFFSNQYEHAKDRINNIVCYLIIDSNSSLNAIWIPLANVNELATEYIFGSYHASSGFPIFIRRQ